MSRVLIVGVNGMLGASLFRYFSCETEHTILGTLRSVEAAGTFQSQGFENLYFGLDIRDLSSLEFLIKDFAPDFVFNCVGLIKQLEESKSPIPSVEINSLFPHRLASLCDSVEAKLVHFSTDCVFSGSRGSYSEEDIPDAFDLYGRSKLLGEVAYGRHLTLRTSIIGHELGKSVSLVDWFLSQTGSVRGFSRAIFSGLPTVCVAEFLDQYIVTQTSPAGLLHLSVDAIDKYTLLRLIAERYGSQTIVEKHEEFRIDRSLDSTKLRQSLGVVTESWELMIEKMHCEYRKYFF